MEIVFSVTQEADGGFVAEGLSVDIFTQGDTWNDLRTNGQEAVTSFFRRIHLTRTGCRLPIPPRFGQEL